jgi:hypothetical protein
MATIEGETISEVESEVETISSSLPLSSSVQGGVGTFDPSERITSWVLVKALFNRHPEYGSGAAGKLADVSGPTEGQQQRVSDWIEEVSLLYDQQKVPLLDGRLLIYGLAQIDQRLRAYLEQSGFISALLPEIQKENGDNPAIVDELGRRPFAEVIAQRIDQVRGVEGTKQIRSESHLPGAFMVHIHGPWGSGKTSVLNFLRADLQSKSRQPNQRWIVVEFNAWRNQRIRPSWWTLVKEVHTQATGQLNPIRSIWLHVHWLLWRIRADWLPVFLAVALILIAVLLTTGIINFFPEQTGADSSGSTGSLVNNRSDDLAKAIELGLKILTAAFAAGAAVFAFSRSLAFGSARTAQTYMELRSDPLGPIVRLFGKLVKSLRRPLVIFVDDLDRCDAQYVVELLEGIQTLFRTAPVVYVVAADRKWICSSLEKSYETFGKTIGELGRPLGYLFLDKMFQVSAAVPSFSSEVRYTYWKGLLSSAENAEKIDERRKEAERRALDIVKEDYTQEQLQAKIDEVRDDPVQEQAMRVAAAKQITSNSAERETEHRLQRYVDLLEPNPRFMKRLVNAIGLHQATHFLEGREVSPEALVRWTILELRWPLFSDFLAAHPQSVGHLANGNLLADDVIPDELKNLFGNSEVQTVSVGLDEFNIRQIVL